jgi:putative endonuclease
MAGKQQDGTEAELSALRFLQDRSLRPVRRNYRCRGGEIDLVMRDADVLVFVEVRLRRNRAFGGALASVDGRKQRRLILAAQHYLQSHSWAGPCRFDVVGIDARGECEWVRNAFEAG